MRPSENLGRTAPQLFLIIIILHVKRLSLKFYIRENTVGLSVYFNIDRVQKARIIIYEKNIIFS